MGDRTQVPADLARGERQWAVGLLVDAAVRVVISYTLPIGVVPGLGGALYPVTYQLPCL